jgi:hypothetical protein
MDDPSDTALEDTLARIRAQLNLDVETQSDLLAEMGAHLEDAVAEARERGLSEREALAEAAARFGVEETGTRLQETHAGWGTAEGVLAAALPVLCALVLRWLVFAPDGTAMGWPQLLVRPAFWVVAGVALLVPLLKFGRWRYALVTWVFFWIVTVITLVWPAYRW